MGFAKQIATQQRISSSGTLFREESKAYSQYLFVGEGEKAKTGYRHSGK
jgi:hypothetical protein